MKCPRGSLESCRCNRTTPGFGLAALVSAETAADLDAIFATSQARGNEGLMIKDPGPGGMRLSHVPLDMSFADAFGGRNPDAYERLLMDVVRGSQALFMRRDEVEAAWAWIDPILEAWAASSDLPKPYTSGTWGPSAAVALPSFDSWTSNPLPPGRGP